MAGARHGSPQGARGCHGLKVTLLGGELLGTPVLAPPYPPSTPPFAQGLERTEHEGFGGGNTAWEEEKLSKYRHR